jgi:hypothetical protein
MLGEPEKKLAGVKRSSLFCWSAREEKITLTTLTTIVNVGFSWSLLIQQNKLECLSLANLFSLFYNFWIRLCAYPRFEQLKYI